MFYHVLYDKLGQMMIGRLRAPSVSYKRLGPQVPPSFFAPFFVQKQQKTSTTTEAFFFCFFRFHLSANGALVLFLLPQKKRFRYRASRVGPAGIRDVGNLQRHGAFIGGFDMKGYVLSRIGAPVVITVHPFSSSFCQMSPGVRDSTEICGKTGQRRMGDSLCDKHRKRLGSHTLTPVYFTQKAKMASSGGLRDSSKFTMLRNWKPEGIARAT